MPKYDLERMLEEIKQDEGEQPEKAKALSQADIQRLIDEKRRKAP